MRRRAGASVSVAVEHLEYQGACEVAPALSKGHQMDLVTLEAFDSVEEAHLAKNRLESEGIACFIQDGATTGQFGPHRPGFSAKLQVSQEHAERARQILREVKRGRSTE
jgi:hypothetical protein